MRLRKVTTTETRTVYVVIGRGEATSRYVRKRLLAKFPGTVLSVRRGTHSSPHTYVQVTHKGNT